MQVLEWAAMYPDSVGAMVPIAIGAQHSAWAIGLNEVARRAIMADPEWRSGHYQLSEQPETGLGLARAIAMLSYRSFDSLQAKFGRDRLSDRPVDPMLPDPELPAPTSRRALEMSFEIASYLNYQGVKLVE